MVPNTFEPLYVAYTLFYQKNGFWISLKVGHFTIWRLILNILEGQSFYFLTTRSNAASESWIIQLLVRFLYRTRRPHSSISLRSHYWGHEIRSIDGSNTSPLLNPASLLTGISIDNWWCSFYPLSCQSCSWYVNWDIGLQTTTAKILLYYCETYSCP